MAVALIATALVALIGCSDNSVAGRYENEGGVYLELSNDGSFFLSPLFSDAIDGRRGTYTQAADGSLTFEAVAEGQMPAQAFSATLDGVTLTLTFPKLTFPTDFGSMAAIEIDLTLTKV